MLWLWTLLVVIVAVVAYDLSQRRHAILRNFPIVGHFRYILEAVGPELRQYIVTNNNEERPFSRGSATVDLRIVETREHILRVRFRQRDGVEPELSDRQTPGVSAQLSSSR